MIYKTADVYTVTPAGIRGLLDSFNPCLHLKTDTSRFICYVAFKRAALLGQRFRKMIYAQKRRTRRDLRGDPVRFLLAARSSYYHLFASREQSP
jgi:hypothetical protein